MTNDDAYDDEGRPELSEIGAESWANLLRVIDNRDTGMRERIAVAIDRAWAVKRRVAGATPDAYDEGYLDALEDAARIARGQA